jgi:GDPmannose 4,6-dehydratase
VKSALITGIAGQDGVYLARHLRSLGYSVAGTVRSLSEARPQLDSYLPGVEVCELDIRNSVGLGEFLATHRPDEIYNLASWSSVGRSWQAPEQVTAVNGVAVLGLLEQIRRLRDQDGYNPRVCQASTSEIYDPFAELPMTEVSPQKPGNPYAVAKAFAHHTVEIYRKAYEIHVSNAILFNHESPIRPDSFVTRKITQGAAAIAQGRQQSLTLGRLDVRRDWGAAADYVTAMHLIVQLDEPTDFNLATGKAHSLQDFLRFAFEAAGVSGYESRIETDSALLRPADMPESRGDTTKALAALDWEPTLFLPELVGKMVEADLARGAGGAENDPAYL